MSTSLRDQLIQAGIVTEKQARQAMPPVRRPQQSKKKPAPIPEHKLAVQQEQAAKAARDQELNRRHQEKTERRARLAQVRQLVEQSCLPRIDSDDYFNFVDGSKVRRIAVNVQRREQLNRGELVIVRCDNRYELVPAAAAARISEREPSVVVAAAVTAPQVDADDAYREYVVPDDMMW